MKLIIDILKRMKEDKIYPKFDIISSALDTEAFMNNVKVIMFASNNYLGLANNNLMKEAAKEAINRYGISTCTSRVSAGNLDIHLALERKIAGFLKRESSIVFTTGYMANTGVISAIMDVPIISLFGLLSFDKGLIISDELNHASLIDGCRLSKAEKIIYKHKDMKDLESILIRNKKRRKLIIADAVFSLDGDITPVDKIVELAKKYNAMTMVDEAHSVGVFGKNGRGITEYFNVEGQVDILMGSLSKAFGCIGGYIAGTKDLTDFLRVTARTYIFTAGPLPPAETQALSKAIEIISENGDLRKNLWENTNYLKDQLIKSNFNILNSESPIIPILIGDEDKTTEIKQKLFAKGILVGWARWPAVPKGMARLRCTVTAGHTKEQLNYLLDCLLKLDKQYKITGN